MNLFAICCLKASVSDLSLNSYGEERKNWQKSWEKVKWSSFCASVQSCKVNLGRKLYRGRANVGECNEKQYLHSARWSYFTVWFCRTTLRRDYNENADNWVQQTARSNSCVFSFQQLQPSEQNGVFPLGKVESQIIYTINCFQVKPKSFCSPKIFRTLNRKVGSVYLCWSICRYCFLEWCKIQKMMDDNSMDG